jgi:predicted DNA-binding transcriptional regulator AlpA
MNATVVDAAPRATESARQIAAILGTSERQVKRLYDAGLFPRPIMLGGRLRVWVAGTAERWLREREREAARQEVAGAK